MLNEQQKRVWLSWEKFLNPSKLKQNLVEASIFLAAYEILRNSVEGRLRDFYCIDAEEGKESASCKSKVVALHPKDRFHASLLWFRQNEALNDLDIEAVAAIRRHRNAIAHELPSFIARHEYKVDRTHLGALAAVIAKVDRWWVRECEPPLDENLEEIDVSEVPDEEIHSGNMIMLDLILSVFDGDETLLLELYRDVSMLEVEAGKETTEPSS
jgi:hypothetical protein